MPIRFQRISEWLLFHERAFFPEKERNFMTKRALHRLFASFLAVLVTGAIAEGADRRITRFSHDENGTVRLSMPMVSTETGYTYQVMGKENLTDAAWEQVGEAAGFSLEDFAVGSVRNGKTYRFFKVVADPRPALAPQTVTKTYYYSTMLDPTGFANPSDCLREGQTQTQGYKGADETTGCYAYCKPPNRNQGYFITVAREGIGSDVPADVAVVSTKVFVRLYRNTTSGTGSIADGYKKGNCFNLHIAGDVAGAGWVDAPLTTFADKDWQNDNIGEDKWVTLSWDLASIVRGGTSHLQIGAYRTSTLTSTEFRVAWAKIVVIYSVPQRYTD
jgi:hypothetical protein